MNCLRMVSLVLIEDKTIDRAIELTNELLLSQQPFSDTWMEIKGNGVKEFKLGLMKASYPAIESIIS